jgi:hypothetical protein
MKKTANYLVLALIFLTMTGCSSEMNKDQAEAKLMAAHDECVSKSLKAEIPEFEINFEATSSGLVYRYKDQLDRSFIKCISLNLFGKDVTALEHTREDKLKYESRGGDSAALDDMFHSGAHEGWTHPIAFVRFDWWEEESSYYLTWFAPVKE